jgi:hypothetical protein
MTMGKCPVCGTPGASSQATVAGYADTDAVECLRCGRFLLREGLLQRRAINNSRVSHALRTRYDATPRKPPFLRDADLQPYQDDLSQIPPQQQLDNFILWVGNNQGAPHEWAKSDIHSLAARVGSAIGSDTSELGVTWIINEFNSEGLYSFRRGSGGPEESYQLKPKGWIRFGELNRRVIDSRNAFMAMKFGDAKLDKVLKDCFQPAAARAGFTLRALNETPSAGLIDNQIRAAIRSARFVIADLSHANNGAYFEAGFAEGLGLPVIYTCEAVTFDEKKTHFDTNHMHTVTWDENKLEEARRVLTDTIRNTLPLESMLDD